MVSRRDFFTGVAGMVGVRGRKGCSLQSSREEGGDGRRLQVGGDVDAAQ